MTKLVKAGALVTLAAGTGVTIRPIRAPAAFGVSHKGIAALKNIGTKEWVLFGAIG